MGQPVRKKIMEVHGEEVGKKPIYTLLIDGNSLLKVAMRDEMISDKGEHVGGIFQFLIQLKKLMTQRDWDYVYCFFDDHDSGILRYNIYKDYKANRDKDYENSTYGKSDYWKEYNENLRGMQRAIFNKKKSKTNDIEYDERTYIDAYKEGRIKEKELIDRFGEEKAKELVRIARKEIDNENFSRERERILHYLNELFIRWEMDDQGTEADDLIAYYIKNKKPEDKCVIVSTDMDLTQLLSEDVYIYNPHLHKNITSLNFKKEFGYPYQNVVTKKILCGDTSDNISNISLLSEKKLFETVPEMLERAITVDEVIEKTKELIEERIKEKKKPLKVHENIVNGVGNKQYDGDFYEINRKLVDLSEPLMTEQAKEEMDAMMYAPQDPDGRSFSHIYALIKEDGISELYDESKFSTFFSSFKPLIKREVERFEKND